MDINKRFEHDKLKKFQIFNAAQLKYIAKNPKTATIITDAAYQSILFLNLSLI